jgi:hypothetical protein
VRRAAALLLVPLAACLGGQSARTLAPGRTALTVGLARTHVEPDADRDETRWAGQVLLRRGLGSRVDVGVLVARSPGDGFSRSTIAVEPRVQLTPPASRITVSLGATVGALIHDDGNRHALAPQLDLALLRPTAYLGVDLAPTAELVLAPTAWFGRSNDHGAEAFTAVGGALGLRLTDRARTWAVHPELGYLAVLDEDERFVTVGLSVSAGN